IGAAYALNDPLVIYTPRREVQAASTLSLPSLFRVDRPNIVIETIKQAEDGNGIIVRLYESQRRRGPITITAGFDLAEVWYTNLLEENSEQLQSQGNQVSFVIKPYEIVTLRLVRA
ncbi:MAG TPA: glycosyl hydrolase-related protein, partial [Ktedonobacteraceae bacterium]